MEEGLMQRVYVILLVLVVLLGAGGYWWWTERAAQSDFAVIRAEALAFYQQQNPAMTGLTARVIDYGCHVEVEIRQGGQPVARLERVGPGNFYVIGR
jgi:hypothetical protein